MSNEITDKDRADMRAGIQRILDALPSANEIVDTVTNHDSEAAAIAAEHPEAVAELTDVVNKVLTSGSDAAALIEHAFVIMERPYFDQIKKSPDFLTALIMMCSVEGVKPLPGFWSIVFSAIALFLAKLES